MTLPFIKPVGMVDPWVLCQVQMGWFTWNTGMLIQPPCPSFLVIFLTIINNLLLCSTGRHKLGKGQMKSKPKDPAKRHHLFKRRFGWEQNELRNEDKRNLRLMLLFLQILWAGILYKIQICSYTHKTLVLCILWCWWWTIHDPVLLHLALTAIILHLSRNCISKENPSGNLYR